MGLCSCPTGRGTQGGAVPGPVSLWASVHQLLNYFHRLHQLSSFLSPGIPLASPHCHLPNRWREALCSLALRFFMVLSSFSLFLAYLAQLAGVGVEVWSHPLPAAAYGIVFILWGPQTELDPRSHGGKGFQDEPV